MKKYLLTLTHLFALAGAMTLSAQRNALDFDADWRFHFGNASRPSLDFGCGTEYFNYLTKAASIHNEGPYCNKFKDSLWTKVDLPHDFVVDLPFASDASHSHGYKMVGHKYPATSVGWYRKTFRMDEADRGKHVEILFDGIFRDSRVWVNGFYCGGERSGYLSQNYDITDYINWDGDNIVCVRSDATLEEGWFYEGGGIYRHVTMNITDPVHVVQDGMCITTSLADGYRRAVVTASAQVQNGRHEAVKCRVRYTVKDAQGNTVKTAEGAAMNLRAMDTSAENVGGVEIEVADPNLWSTDTPYIYTLTAEVMVDGKVVDTKTERFGMREVRFDKDQGLLINGRNVKLKGVNMHQDHAGVGAGIPDALQAYRIRQLKAFGCNAYRSSHNPMSPAMLDVCDSLGILVIDENRLSGISEYEIDGLRRMIRRDRNHPSVILWSAGNEEWGIEWTEKGEAIARTMRDYCHIFDPSREMTFATSGGPTVEVPVDVAGYNYIMQNPVEEHRAKYPERKCYGSEETTGCGTRGIYYDDPEGRWMAALNRSKNGKDSIMNCIERGWRFYAERPWAAGCFFWTGFDYRGEPNPLSFPATGSEFGILDYCGFPKDEAYYLKAWWTDETVLHLLPHWNLAGHEGEKVSVWAYSNCDEVELFVNGKSVGRKTMPRNGHLEWDAVYKPGKLMAVGYRNGKKVKTETVETTGNAVSAAVTVDRAAIKADGKDVAVVTVALKDAKGRVVPTACDDLSLHIDGEARILGVGNGDPAYRDTERPADREARDYSVKAFNGYAQILVQSHRNAGNAVLTVTMPNGKAAKIALKME